MYTWLHYNATNDSMTDQYRYVSPRTRAQRTFELLEIGCRAQLPWKELPENCAVRTEAAIEVTESVREWDYGNYEGLTSATIRKQRKEQRIDGSWDIWADGCPGGEYVHSKVTESLQ